MHRWIRKIKTVENTKKSDIMNIERRNRKYKTILDHQKFIDETKYDLTDDEIEALNTYSGSHYTYINLMSRNSNDPIIKRLKENDPKYYKRISDTIEVLEKALNKYSVGEDVILYRGINSEKFYNDIIKKKGKKITEKGFFSVSTNLKIAENFSNNSNSKSVIIEFRVPKETKGIKMNKDLSIFPNETEVLINRNLEYKIIDIIDTEKYRKVIAEIL